MIKEDQISRIKQLHAEGLSVRAIAATLGIHRWTVKMYIEQPLRGLKVTRKKRPFLLEQANQEKLKALYQSVNFNCAVLRRCLVNKPELVDLAEGFTISERAVRRYFQEKYPYLRRPPKRAWQPFVCSPGQQLQIDFTEAKFKFSGQASEQKIYLFEAVYTYSHKGFVYICPDMTQASWLLGIAQCFVRFGIPREILCDNAKSLVLSNTKSSGAKFHPDFEWLCSPLGVRPRACQPCSPQTKGRVERIGGFIKHSALPEISVTNDIKSIAQLQVALDKWMAEVADARTFDGKTVRDLYTQERASLAFPENMVDMLSIACKPMIASAHASVHFFGTRIELPASCANTMVYVAVRHNGEYHISNAKGSTLVKGWLEPEKLQIFRFEDRQPSPSQDKTDLETTVFTQSEDFSALSKILGERHG